MTSKPFGYAAILTCAVLLGMWATVGKVALAAMSPLTAAIFVQAITAVVFAPSLRRLSLTRRQWKLTVVAAVAGAFVAPSAYFVGLNLATPPDAALLSNTEAMFTIVFAFAILGERLSPRGYAAVAAILGGAVLVTLDVGAPGPDFATRVTGDLLLLLSAAMWGIDNTASRIVTRDHDIPSYVSVKTGIGSLLLAPIAFAFSSSIAVPPAALPLALFLALTGGALFTFLFFGAMRAIGAIRVGAILGTSAAWGVAIAVAVGFPPPGPLQLLGGAVMIVAVLVLYRQPTAASPPRRTSQPVAGPGDALGKAK